MRMLRLTLALAVWIGLVPVVNATLTPRKESTLGKSFPAIGSEEGLRLGGNKRLARIAGKPVQAGTRSEYVVTHQTQILLNGKPCKYEEVPPDASIVRMEVAADKKTVLKIHFRTRK
jgi:hypothetical protein